MKKIKVTKLIKWFIVLTMYSVSVPVSLLPVRDTPCTGTRWIR